MRKYILFSIIVLAALWVLGSAQSIEAATINAASCSYADVSAAISAASRGDTVLVPAGSCSLTSILTITKGITLQGAGIDQTTITGDSGLSEMISFEPDSETVSNNTAFEITGFTFDGSFPTTNTGMIFLENYNATPLTKIKIHHNKFKNTVKKAIYASGLFYGVIYSNQFDRVNNPFTSMGGDNLSWDNLPRTYGSANNLYFEDNTIGFSSSTDGNGGIYSGQGGRYVGRYNTWNLANVTDGDFLDIHGLQTCGPPGASPVCEQYASMVNELYGNLAINSPDIWHRWMYYRGSQAMMFNNTYGYSGGAPTIQIGQYGCNSCAYLEEGYPQAVDNTYFWNNLANGTGIDAYVSYDNCTGTPRTENTHFWNYNGSCTASSCSSGVGCGSSVPSGTCTTGVGYWVTDYSSCSTPPTIMADMKTYTQAGRFYKCTSTNTWTLYYQPYTYPHPLRSDSPVQTCTYTYSAWGACQSDNTQTRTVISSSPSGCTGTPILTQSCVYTNFLPEQYIQAESGQLSSMQTGTSGSDTYIYTTTDNTGSVKFTFDISQAGQYKMEAKVNSNNDSGRNSFYVGLDSEAAQGNSYYVFDTAIVSAFTWDSVNRRGTGTAISEFDPFIWNLTAGLHTFWFYGKEANTWLDQIILKRVTADTTPPAAPTGVAVN